MDSAALGKEISMRVLGGGGGVGFKTCIGKPERSERVGGECFRDGRGGERKGRHGDGMQEHGHRRSEIIGVGHEV